MKGSQKREPIPHGIRPGFAGQIGSHLGNHVMDRDGNTVKNATEPMYANKGYKAPKSADCCHPTGSQGKHR